MPWKAALPRESVREEKRERERGEKRRIVGPVTIHSPQIHDIKVAFAVRAGKQEFGDSYSNVELAFFPREM